ncbi:MAG: hypothetical protein F6K40_00415 [Okeania sp. SIO3I5]|uniref:hypothetical protein n=1 Tax=Okeania sp. SIO3I5 TaxID=2607805 RepID=UPI0013B81EF9|nr:hypothetical protein [Okeania sp. SIO3I5]NEQ34854.1 hypothetical protein [Okeania sp. SIO3I5]
MDVLGGVGSVGSVGGVLESRRNNFSLIFLPRPAPKSSLYAALFTEKLILFHDLKCLKPLSVNAFIFNQQALCRNTYRVINEVRI